MFSLRGKAQLSQRTCAKNDLYLTAATNRRSVEEWKLDFEWLRVRHLVKDAMGRTDLPDLNSMLFLIGMQEVGQVRESFTKEEKQDLMHVAVCVLLTDDGYFEFTGMDADGWPHFKQVRPLDIKGVKAQEELLKERVIQYLTAHLAENENTIEQ